MKKILTCPKCQNSKYVVMYSTSMKIGCILGAGVGCLVGYLGYTIPMPDAPIKGKETMPEYLQGMINGTILGAALGKQIDEVLIGRHRCLKCGLSFNI